ncbi:MAG: 23S rRNA (uracil(1939)-C(5))-methyltransferase RlmD [Eubacteriales bacterium]|nr:23S rRNA (uracil(1939)-C(5))-methyltransferase RlmD [Eubacteriales bacterium]
MSRRKKQQRINTTLCYIEKDGKYLMLLRNKKENDLNEGKWIGIGGKFEKDETPDECLIREVREETGITLTKYEQRGVIGFVSDTWNDETMYLYTATAYDGEINYNCDEGELRWIDIDEVMNLNLWEGDRLFLKRLVEGDRDIRMTLHYEGDTLKKVWCSQSGICGGCFHNGLTYDEQHSLKEEKLKELLMPVMEEDSIFEGVLDSPLHEGYKNKMEYSFGDAVKDGPLTLGMHRKKSFYAVVTCDDCRLVNDDNNKVVRATVDYFDSLHIPYVNKSTHEGYLRHLLVRRSFANGGLLIDLVTADYNPTEEMKAAEGFKDEASLLNDWVEILKGLNLEGHIDGILHTRNNSLADAVIDEGTEVLFGRDYLEEELLGLKFKVTPFSFFQTNTKGAEVLYSKVRDYVGDTSGMTVYDLYSGTGTIAQLVAAVADKVYGVEIITEAVEAAKENAKMNGLNNCEFIAGDVLEVIGSLEKKPDMIILDPPRDGLHPKMLPIIAGYGVEHIVYVACKPESFVRDMEFFKARGYRVVKAAGVDQFPYTKHVEAVVLLSKAL